MLAGHKRVSSRSSCVMCLTFQVLFESIWPLSTGDSGHSVTLKGVELNPDVSLSISFGHRYVQFSLPVASSSEPVAKCPSPFNVLLANVVRRDELPARHKELPEKPKLFLPKKISPQRTDPNFFRQSSGNKIFLVWPNIHLSSSTTDPLTYQMRHCQSLV